MAKKYTTYKISQTEILIGYGIATWQMSESCEKLKKKKYRVTTVDSCRSKDKRDIDVLRENHQFLWGVSDQADTWEKQLARRYYDKLFKEYCICDLSHYKENKVTIYGRCTHAMHSTGTTNLYSSSIPSLSSLLSESVPCVL